MVIAILDLIRVLLRRLGPLGVFAALLLGIYIEVPLIEQTAINQARAAIRVVITAEERGFQRLEHLKPGRHTITTSTHARRTKR